MFRLILAMLLLALAGCSVMQPTLSIEEMHESHASQHFGPDPTNYGFDAIQLNLHVGIGKRFYVDMAEGATLEGCRHGQCGGLDGPREEFNGRVGVILAQ
jgi:hypothetical protein